MPDIFYLLSKWWKQVLAVVLLSLITAATINVLLPKKYLSVTTALPANSYLADKARIFNENIEALYSTMGTADELDMITGTGQLDTVYFAVTDQFDLSRHYTMSETGDAARNKAASLLKKNSKVMKSEYGELKVKVWNKDKKLAPQLANAVMDKIQEIHSQLQNSNNRSILASLIAGSKKLKAHIDSTGDSKQQALVNQLQQYEKLIGEYQLMADSKPSALLIVERARTAGWPDKPKLLPVLLATGFLSLLFGLLVALVLERRKTSRK